MMLYDVNKTNQGTLCKLASGNYLSVLTVKLDINGKQRSHLTVTDKMQLLLHICQQQPCDAPLDVYL